MNILQRFKTPAARLEFLEVALAGPIAEAERAAQTQRAAERAAAVRSRADELAAIDADRAGLDDALGKAAKTLDVAIRARRAADAIHSEAYDAVRSASIQRELIVGRYERILAAVGGDAIATTAYRLRWLGIVARDHLAIRVAPKDLLRHQRAVDYVTLDWNPERLAEVIARELPAVEALALSTESPEKIESACAAALTHACAAASESLVKWAPWSTVTSNAEVH